MCVVRWRVPALNCSLFRLHVRGAPQCVSGYATMGLPTCASRTTIPCMVKASSLFFCCELRKFQL